MTTEALTSPSDVHSPPARKKGMSMISKVLIILALIIASLGLYWWWSNRPIKPVVLSAAELTTVEQKVETLQESARPEPQYQPGEKEIHLTEREINGLLNKHTALGETVKLELATDAVHARIQTKLDPDFPIGGGKTLKARARVQVKMDGEKPALVLEDLTIWGISLPNDWLGGLKGKNFLDEVFGGKVELSGIETIQVKNGEILLKLKD